MSSTETALVSVEAAVKQAAANSHCDPEDIRNQVVDVGAAVAVGDDDECDVVDDDVDAIVVAVDVDVYDAVRL